MHTPGESRRAVGRPRRTTDLPKTGSNRSYSSQLSLCRELLRRDPTHLDSHQHMHTEEPARSILDGLARELGVPLRHRSP